jgi:hypothetical protein
MSHGDEAFLQAIIAEKQARIEALEASLAEWKALAIQWAKDNDRGHLLAGRRPPESC